MSGTADDFLRQRRAAIAEHPSQIGLDYVEAALDLTRSDRRILALHFIPAQGAAASGKHAVLDGLTADNLRFTANGVPVNDLLTIDVGPPAPDAPQVTVTMTFKDGVDLARLPGGGTVYTVELVDVENLDPFFSRADFSLDPEVPLAEDCREICQTAPTTAGAPVAGDYLAKDFASFRQRMLDHLAQKLPGWTERNPADLMVTLVELLADAADRVSYFQDAVATEAYLGTARLRTSVRRHARLVGYQMHEGANARVWVHLAAADPAPGETAVLAARTQLLTRVPGAPIRLARGSSELAQALAAGPTVFETLHDVTLRPEQNAILLYDWGAEEIVLPAGATGATLRGHDLGLAPGDVLILEQVAGKLPSGVAGQPPEADRALRHAVRLTRKEEGEDPLATDGAALLTHVEWQAGDALPFPLPLASLLPNTGVPLKDRAVARGNVVLADHGRTVEKEEELTVPDLQGRPFRPRLQRRGLTHSAPYDHTAALGLPAAAALDTPASDARPALELTGTDGRPWTLRRDLLGSDGFARHFVVEMEDDGTAVLRFGDGTLGRPPAPRTALYAEYRTGNGAGGNVGRDSLFHVVSVSHPVTAVRNPLPAAGGIDPEGLDHVRLAAPGSIDALETSSLLDGVVARVEAHPGVERAIATLRWTGSWNLLEVAVQRQGGLPVDEAFAGGLRSALEDLRIAGWELVVVPLESVGLDIALTVLLDPDVSRGRVERALLDRFSNRDLPGGGRGFFHPANLASGQAVYLSRIVEAALGVPGVRAVDIDETPPKANRFRRFGVPSRGELAAGEIRLRRGELARVDNDPTVPANGRIQFFLEGGR